MVQGHGHGIEHMVPHLTLFSADDRAVREVTLLPGPCLGLALCGRYRLGRLIVLGGQTLTHLRGCDEMPELESTLRPEKLFGPDTTDT